MRVNKAPRGEAERVAARVSALLGRSDSVAHPDGYLRADLVENDLNEPTWSAASVPGGFGDTDDTGDTNDTGDTGDTNGRGLPVSEPDIVGATRPGSRHFDVGWWDRLSARVPLRLDPGRRGALAVGVAVVVAALVTGAWLVSNRPQAVPVSASVPSVPGAGALVGTDGVTEGASSSAVSGAVSASAATVLVVDVAGKVRNPGVYRLPAGSRVDDALHAAGGTRGHVDMSKLNLAALLVDGQQVAVGVPPATGGDVPAGGGVAATGSTGATTVELNTAPLEQLETLPGVGPVLGQDILDYRAAHGPFTSTDQLKDVSGIGDVTYDDLKSLVTV